MSEKGESHTERSWAERGDLYTNNPRERGGGKTVKENEEKGEG